MKTADVQRIKAGFAYEASRTGPPDTFPQLPDIPGGRYVDPNFFEMEKQGLWRRTWLYGIHGDEVPAIGSYLRWDRTGEPLFFIRGEDDRVRCFYNTCRHRGAPVLSEPSGTSRGFSCKYHGWTYNTRGELINLRDKRDFVGLDTSCRSLFEIRCENLGRWHFINFDPNAEPLLDYMGPVGEGLAEMAPDKLKLIDKIAIKVNCNVKVLLDAFLEVYHLRSIHQHTVDRFLDHRGSYITLWPKGHSRMVTPFKREGWQDPGAIGLPDTPGVDPFLGATNLSLNLYPNLVTPLAPAGFPFLVFWPETLSTMTIECHWFGPSWGDGPRPEVWNTRLRNFVKILDEDLQFADAIQKSVQSSGVKGFPLNYQERRIYHWHEELDRRIGQDKVPAGLRIPFYLDDFVEKADARPVLAKAG